MFFQCVEKGRKRKTVCGGSSEAERYLLAAHLPQFNQFAGFRQVQEKNAAENPEKGKKVWHKRQDKPFSGMKKLARNLQNPPSERIS
jgi:hypothetical protein